jgi:hypothetical protein
MAGRHLIQIALDAADVWPNGVVPRLRWAPAADLPATERAAAVADWAEYDGAIVAVGTSDGASLTILGSGVMVAPGLVITATHVLRDDVDGIEAKSLAPWCLGPRQDGRADLWLVRQMRFGETDSDISFLAVEPYSELADDWTLTCLPLTTRYPMEGDALTVVGFRFDDADAKDLPEIDGIRVISRGRLYASSGTVQQVGLYRDRTMMPFPFIEISCGTLGGMSGGAVLDTTGAVIGILSVGLSHDDGRGPSNAAWIIHALQFNVPLRWPRDVYPPDCPILDLPDDLLRIIGRKRVTLSGPMQIDYKPWR